jgi:hypothetical protein
MAKLSAFGQAFANARKEGLKEFEFNGKKYGTKLASEVEQPSVGGKAIPGEYKTRAPYSDRGNTLTEKNQMRRDMSQRMAEIDRETQGDETAMKYVPRRTPKPLTEVTKPGTRTNYENEEATSETFKRGGSVKASSASRRADGIATKGKTKGRYI